MVNCKKLKFISIFAAVLACLLGGAALWAGGWYYRFSKLENLCIEHRYDSATGKVAYSFSKTPPGYWIFLKDLDKKSYGGIVISEDWGFYQHHGIDAGQMKDALFSFIKQGNKLRGASTITQQLVKNIYLTPRRSWWRKGQEILLALLIDKALSKEKILELYLNVIEYGRGVYGISNAAFYYFKKSPHDLTPREGAFLAVLLPSPKKYSQSFREQKLSKFITTGIYDVLSKMKIAGYLSEEEYVAASNDFFFWEDSSFSLDDSQYLYFNDQNFDDQN